MRAQHVPGKPRPPATQEAFCAQRWPVSAASAESVHVLDVLPACPLCSPSQDSCVGLVMLDLTLRNIHRFFQDFFHRQCSWLWSLREFSLDSVCTLEPPCYRHVEISISRSQSNSFLSVSRCISDECFIDGRLTTSPLMNMPSVCP